MNLSAVRGLDTSEEDAADSDESSLPHSFESPNTAWKRRNREQEQLMRRQQEGKILARRAGSSDSSSEDENEHFVIEKSPSRRRTDSATLGRLGSYKSRRRMSRSSQSLAPAISSPRKDRPSKGAAEHVDGFFRNLVMTPEDAKLTTSRSFKSMNFYSMNATVASRQQSRISLDSLTSSSSSDSSSSSSSSSLSQDSVVSKSRRRPRQAYSESNMQNSLGYLP
jgi:hypothetical protein